MPLYEYLCESCGRRSEVLQRMDEPPRTTCPDCGGVLRKLFSAPSFQFKGTGWYQTDYARKGGGGESKAGESKSGESKASESQGGDARSGETKSGPAAAASSGAAGSGGGDAGGKPAPGGD